MGMKGGAKVVQLVLEGKSLTAGLPPEQLTK
jgi:hypothetical protein